MKSTRHVFSHNPTGVGILLSVLCVALSALGQGQHTSQVTGVPDYDLTWNTVDGGGVMFSTGGDLELSGTIGQPDAGAMSGGEFTLTGGFWFPLVPGDVDGDGGITLDDYEHFTRCMSGEGTGPAEGCASFDSDRDDDVDLKDFSAFQLRFSGS